MDKSTLSNYGWVVIVTLVLSVMLAFATPFGSYIGRATANLIKYYKTFTGDTFSADYIEGQGGKWDEFINEVVTPEEIESNELMFGIGKTKSEYVIAVFNEDYTEVFIRKNGKNSDGYMKDFGVTPETKSPMVIHADTLKKVIVEEGVVSIGKCACRGLTKVTRITLPDSLKLIDYCGFHSCYSLKELTLPKNLETIGGYSFLQLGASNVWIPASVKSIGEAAFANAYNTPSFYVAPENPNYVSVDGVIYTKDLTTLVQYPAGKTTKSFDVLPSTKHIMGYAVADCDHIENLTLPEGLEKVDAYAFASSTFIKNISLPSTLTYVGDCAFRYCVNVGTSITIPKGLTKIGKGAFGSIASKFIIEEGNPNYKIVNEAIVSMDGSTLIAIPAYYQTTTYTVPYGITKLEHGCCLSSRYITELIIPDTVTTIETGIFSNAIKGTTITVTIPSSVTNIHKDAFIDQPKGNFIIQCERGSTAEAFAIEHGFYYTFI